MFLPTLNVLVIKDICYTIIKKIIILGIIWNLVQFLTIFNVFLANLAKFWAILVNILIFMALAFPKISKKS